MRMQADSRRPTPTPGPWLRPDLRHRGTLARIGLAFALLACADAKAALPEPLPHFAGARITPVFDDARIHGVPTRIRQFEARASTASVRAFYQGAVADKPASAHIDGWEVLSWMQGTALRTLRLRPCRSAPAACTEGTLSESDLALAAATFSPAPGRPSDSILSTDLETNDAGRRARILAWHDESSPSWAAARLVRELAAQGLALERRVPVSRPGLDGVGLWFGARGREAVATIVRHGSGTTVTLQTIEHGERGGR